MSQLLVGCLSATVLSVVRCIQRLSELPDVRIRARASEIDAATACVEAAFRAAENAIAAGGRAHAARGGMTLRN